MSKVRDLIGNVYTLLRQDETLLRLLYYPPSPPLDPLSSQLEDILDKDVAEYWDIVDRHILLSSKSEDLEENSLCRIYVYGGKIRPSMNNKLTTKQEIVIDIFCHQKYEKDQRLEWITDTLNEIIFNKRIDKGLGKVDYRTGYDFTAPKWYVAYRHIYEVGGTK